MSDGKKKKVFVCCPFKEDTLYRNTIARIEAMQLFEVTSALTHTDQGLPPGDMFKRNAELIWEADIFVGVLRSYGKDFAAEVGMAYANGNKMIGLVLQILPAGQDIMVACAFELIHPLDLEKTLLECLIHKNIPDLALKQGLRLR